MTARQFLEQLAGDDRPGAVARFWKARRGDIYLGIAIVLVVAVVRWGIWSNHSVSATGKPTPAAAAPRKAPAEPELSLFDRMMISLGLAEAPAGIMDGHHDPAPALEFQYTRDPAPAPIRISRFLWITPPRLPITVPRAGVLIRFPKDQRDSAAA